VAPMREAVQQIAHSPVFVDESGHRRAWVQWALGLGGALCLGYVVLLGFSLAGGPIRPGDLLPLPGLRQTEDRSAVPTPSPTVGVSGSPTAPSETGGPSAGPTGAVPTGGVGAVPTPTPTASGAAGTASTPSGSPPSTAQPSASPAPSVSSPAPTSSSPATPAPSVTSSTLLDVEDPSPSPAGSVGP
jgi:hypothetical protein